MRRRRTGHKVTGHGPRKSPRGSDRVREGVDRRFGVVAGHDRRPRTPAPGSRTCATQTLERLAALQGEHRAVVDASRDSNADDEHDPEGATIAFERAQVDALVRDAVARLESVDDALARIEDGTYGICTRCGEPIAAGRLEARPTATTCVGCA